MKKEEEEQRIVDFAERLRYVLELRIKKLRIAMQKYAFRGRYAMIKIQALEWVEGQIQDLVINRVTKDWSVYK